MTKFGTEENRATQALMTNRATQALMTIAGEVLRYRYPVNAVVHSSVIQAVVWDAAPLVFATDTDITAALSRLKCKGHRVRPL